MADFNQHRSGLSVDAVQSIGLQPGLAARCTALEQDWLGNRLVQLGHAPNLGLTVLAHQDSSCWWLNLCAPHILRGVVAAQVDALPFADASFGTVAVQHVHEFCAEPEKLLAECVRVLVPGGRLLICGFSPYAWSRWHRLRRRFIARPRLFAASRLRLELVQLGLKTDPPQSMPWPESRIERHLPLRAMHALYLLIGLKQPPAMLPVTTRALRLPAGMVTG